MRDVTVKEPCCASTRPLEAKGSVCFAVAALTTLVLLKLAVLTYAKFGVIRPPLGIVG